MTFEAETVAPHPRHTIEDADRCLDSTEITEDQLRRLGNCTGIVDVFAALENLGDDNA